MACFLTRHVIYTRAGGKHRVKTQGQNYALSALSAQKALEITNKCLVANSLVQLESNIQVHELIELERKYWLQFAKLQNTNAICVYDRD